MPEFSSSKIINNCLRVNNEKGESGIGYYIIIGCELMVQIGLTADLEPQFLKWDGATVHRKERRNLLGQSDLAKGEMREVVM